MSVLRMRADLTNGESNRTETREQMLINRHAADMNPGQMPHWYQANELVPAYESSALTTRTQATSRARRSSADATAGVPSSEMRR